MFAAKRVRMIIFQKKYLHLFQGGAQCSAYCLLILLYYYPGQQARLDGGTEKVPATRIRW